MTTPRIEEMVEGFDSKFYYEHQERGLTYLRNDVVGWLRTALTQAHQAERTKRDEMVEQVRLLLAKHYRTEDFDSVGFLEDLQNLTQPNNPKK